MADESNRIFYPRKALIHGVSSPTSALGQRKLFILEPSLLQKLVKVSADPWKLGKP